MYVIMPKGQEPAPIESSALPVVIVVLRVLRWVTGAALLGLVGIGVLFAMGFVCGTIVEADLTDTKRVLKFVAIGVPGLWGLSHLLRPWHERLQRRHAERLAAWESARREADTLTTTLTSLLDSSTQSAAQLPQTLANANGWLEKAEHEFRESAFAPFWDAVEQAVQNLDWYHQTLGLLAKNAHYYYGALHEREHTFPAWPTRSALVPDPTPVLARLGQVVRMGQTNFQFATIWEHRRTREVLVTGFRSLEQAVAGLSGVVQRSLAELETTLSSSVAELVDQQIRTRDEAAKHARTMEEILDNDQRRRRRR